MIKLILFDIDGTLVLTGGAGGRAMARACRRVFGVPERSRRPFPWPAGPTRGLSRRWRPSTAWPATTDDARRFHDVYVEHLLERDSQAGSQKGVLPGVRDVLDALPSHDDAHLGAPDRQFRARRADQARVLRSWRYFRVRRVRRRRARSQRLLADGARARRRLRRSAVRPSDVVIVGDTPLDVAVAVAGGARSLAVATGSYDVEALRASGADVVLEDLSDLARRC